MSATSPRWFVYAALVTQTILSAGTFLAGKRALAESGPLALAALRFALASVAFLVLLRFSGGPVVPPRALWGRLALLGVVGVPLNQGLFLAGLVTTTPAHAALMYALTPLFVFLISLARGSERASGRKLAGLALALAGASMVVFERSGGIGAGTLLGDLLVLGACASWATYTVFQKPLATEHGALAATSWVLVAGTAVFLPVGVPAVLGLELAGLSATFWSMLAFLVLLTSVVSYLCWGYALERLEASRVAIFTNLQPVATALLSWAIFGERITPVLIAGGVLVIAGVFATTRSPGNS